MTDKLEKIEDFVYENIIKFTRYTDHLPHMAEFFKFYVPNNLLEWGLGYSTKFFADKCSKVVSVEALSNFMQPSYYDFFKNILQVLPNWNSVLWVVSDTISEAVKYQIVEKKDPEKVDASYLSELQSYAQALYSSENPDVVFVDSAIFINGDLANTALANNIPFVIIHDSNEVSMCSYDKIVVPANYKTVEIKSGVGTTFFIRNDFEDIFNKMKVYSENLA